MANKLQTIIKSGESETVEFKLGFDREAIETLVAFVRNKQIADTFRAAGLIEKYGSGDKAHTQRIQKLRAA